MSDIIYPVGSIYISVEDINPSEYFGGIWEQVAQGRTLVGVDTSQTEFNTVKKTGGEKTHTLTVNEQAPHSHTLNNNGNNSLAITINAADGGDNYNMNYSYGKSDAGPYIRTTTSGGGQAHNNLQPYFTCYIWCRVS